MCTCMYMYAYTLTSPCITQISRQVRQRLMAMDSYKHIYM